VVTELFGSERGGAGVATVAGGLLRAISTRRGVGVGAGVIARCGVGCVRGVTVGLEAG
jgi:hypothetical protein